MNIKKFLIHKISLNSMGYLKIDKYAIKYMKYQLQYDTEKFTSKNRV